MSQPQYDFFVSFADADADWAKQFLLEPLAAAGLKCITQNSFNLGASWVNEIERAVMASERILIVLTNAYLEQAWNDFTAVLAQSQSIASGRNNFIPIVLDEIKDLRFRALVGIDATDANTWNLILPRLQAELQKPLPALTPEAKQLFLPEPTPIPPTPGFIGRDADLIFFQEQLATTHLAFIGGLPRVGKTWLAARLAAQWRNPPFVFWHTFGSEEDVSVLRWKLAEFLAWHGYAEPLRRLRNSLARGADPEPFVSFLKVMIQTIRDKGYLFCIDNLYVGVQDANTSELVELLRQEVERGGISIIATSRQSIESIEAFGARALKGFSNAETRSFFQSKSVRLTAAQADLLNQKTGGAPALLNVVAEILAEEEFQDALAIMQEDPDIRKYLVREIDKRLDETHSTVMKGVSVLQGASGSRKAIESGLERSDIESSLLDLKDRYLLQTAKEGRQVLYSQEYFLQEFYYDKLDLAARVQIHHRFGEFYKTAGHDPLRAALHFEKSGESVLAAELAIDQVQSNLARGRARLLLRVLEQLAQQTFPSELNARIPLALGQTYIALGQADLAESEIERAVTRLSGLDDSPSSRLLQADVYLALGEFYEQNRDPEESIPIFAKGLEILGDLDWERRAAFYIKLSSAYLALGDYERVLDAVKRGQSLVEPNSHWYAKGETNRGIVASDNGDFQTAAAYARSTIQIGQALNDKLLTAKGLNNLAFELSNLGDRQGEADALEKLHALADELYIFRYQWAARNGLAVYQIEKGQYEQAAQLLTEANELARDRSLAQLPLSLTNMADVQIRTGNPQAAIPFLQEAEPLAAQKQNQELLTEINYLWALALCDSDNAAAQEKCKIALEYAQDIPPEQGKAQRVLGQILGANREYAKAAQAFETSLALLTSFYEIARTQKEYARAILADAASESVARERAREMLSDAQTHFQTLGAQQDLEQVNQLLNQMR